MPYPEKFRKSLCEHNVDGTMIDRIFAGYEELNDKSSKQQKIAFFTRAMQQMDELMNYDTKYEIIDWCACCKGGARDKAIRKLTKEFAGQSLAAKLEALQQVANMGQPSFAEDGTIISGIYYQVGGEYRCACPCFHNAKLETPISATYCLCCAGHMRYHYQNALGVQLKTKEVVSSPLESLGKQPCVFRFEIIVA